MSAVRVVWLNGALLTLVAAAIVFVEAWDRPEAAVEATVQRYADAVSTSDLGAAMAEIAPDQRDRWSAWVQSQLGNEYTVTGVAVRAPWLLARPSEVTVDMDINRDYPDDFYQATPRVAIEAADGKWYLAVPLLAPTSEL